MNQMARFVSIATGAALAILAHASPTYACHRYGVLGMHATKNSLPLENRIADEDGLERFSDAALEDAKRRGVLVRMPDATQSYYLEIKNEWFRYLLPHAKAFDEKLAEEFYRKFRKQIKFTSLVRSLEYQRELESAGEDGIRSNAKSSIPERRSSHPTGATSDISKRDRTFSELKWLCRVLKYWRGAGVVEAYDEYRHNNTLHFMVSKHYALRPSLEEEWKKLIEDLDKPFSKKIFRKKSKKSRRK